MNVLVTAATGTVGAHVVRALAERGVQARAFVRDRERAERMLGGDVELVEGDLADPRSLAHAMRGTERLFLACGNVPAQVEHERAAIDAAAAAGVERVVKLSGPRAAPDSPVPFERGHAEIERHLLGSGLPWVLLRPCTYMTNLLADAATVARTGALVAPAGTAEIAFVDPRDVADAAVGALLDGGHEGRTYAPTGPEAISYRRIAQELSAATGRWIEYVNVPDAAAREALLATGLPAPVADGIVAIFGEQRAGAMARTTDAVLRLTGRRPRPFADFAREHAALFGGAPVAVALPA